MKLTPVKLIQIDDSDDAFFDISRRFVHIDVWWKLVYSITSPLIGAIENNLQLVIIDNIEIAKNETTQIEIGEKLRQHLVKS